jgi:hypothetical protein
LTGADKSYFVIRHVITQHIAKGFQCSSMTLSTMTCIGLHDATQLRKDYGREQADVIVNIVGNIISGQVTGDTAKTLYDRFGRIAG